MTRKTRLIALILSLAMSLGVAGCGSSAGNKAPAPDAAQGSSEGAKPAGEVKYKPEVVIGLANVFTTTDLQSTASITNQIFYTVSHSTLLKWDYDTQSYQPDLAESYTVSPDGTVFTFNLHKDAYFHNGENVKASDVLFTFNRGLEGAATKAKVQIIKGMKAIDDYTVEITLNGPSTGFLFDITNPNMAIFSEKALKDMGDEGTKIGSGAFYYDIIDFGNEVKMVRFDKYFGEKPKSERLTLRQYKEDATRVIALQTGDIDYCQTPSTMELDYIASDPNLELIQMAGTRLNYMVMNVSKKPFSDPKVRQAMNMAVNKEDVVAVAANGFGTVQNYYLTDISYAFNGNIPGYSYNVEEAKRLMKEAGYENGFSFDILCHDSTSRAIAPVLQAQFKEIGVTMEIKEVETAVRNSMIANNEHNACMAAHVNLVSADNNLRLLFYTGSLNNRMKYTNPEFDTKLDAALIEQDETKRIQMYNEMQQFIVDEAV
ncbi:MAG: ABC transporter substrate-binding protein, partial [Angelakisella sp.]